MHAAAESDQGVLEEEESDEDEGVAGAEGEGGEVAVVEVEFEEELGQEERSQAASEPQGTAQSGEVGEVTREAEGSVRGLDSKVLGVEDAVDGEDVAGEEEELTYRVFRDA